MTIHEESSVTRRAVLTGAAAVGVTAALAACGSGPDTGGGAGSGSAAGPATVSAAEVPVGGGKILSAQSVVVTQPTAGTYKAFSAVCTHQGCLVSSVANSTISCACHNSQFSAADGSVITGPASRALAAKTVSVSGDTLTVS
jgi:Rieske Fe-S protein